MENDLISRQAAIDGILHLMPPNPNADDGSAEQLNFSAWKCALTCAEASIKMMPSAQPEIIRCRDCKHYYYADNRIPQEQRYTCDLDGDRWSPDSYCSFAERKENVQ